MTTVAVPGLVPGLQAPHAPGVLQQSRTWTCVHRARVQEGPRGRSAASQGSWREGQGGRPGQSCRQVGSLGRWEQALQEVLGGGRSSCVHTATPCLPGLPEPGLCPVLNRDREGARLPRVGTTSLAPRDSCAGGVFGEVNF